MLSARLLVAQLSPCKTLRVPVLAQSSRTLVSLGRPVVRPTERAVRTPLRLAMQPIRSYNQVKTTQTTTSQQLWRVAGMGAVGGLALVALDGLRESSAVGAYPNYVAARVTQTYGYVAAGLAMTAGFATYIARSPTLFYRIASVNPYVMLIATMAGTIGSMMAVRTIDSKPIQHAAWLAFNGFVGLSLFPVAMLGGALIQRAAIGTAALVGSISLVAATTRTDAHLAMAGPLGVGLGVVFAASIGQLFLPASPLLYNVAVYGGLAVFGGFTFFDTQRMIQKAKHQQVFNPLRCSMSIYMDTINIFTRMLSILQGGGNRRK